MSQTTTITVTSQTGLELVNGKLWTQYDALIAQVTARLSEHHAFLFARPEKALSPGPARVAWLAEDLGEAAHMSSLAPEMQAWAMAELARIEADLRLLAGRMKQEGPASAELARLIEDALVRPPGDWVWLVGNRPVLVNWGYRVSTDEDRIPEKPRTLMAEGAAVKLPPAPPAAAEPPPPPPGSTVPRPRSLRGPLSAALWLLFMALLAVSGYRLLTACSLSDDGLPAFLKAWLPPNCRIATTGPDADLRGRVGQVEADVRAREQAILVKAAQCPLVCVPDPNYRPNIQLPTPQDDINKRLGDVKRGKIELDLLWNSAHDLDLSVVCPGGQSIGFSSAAACGATLELDVNADASKQRVPPIEHIIWGDEGSAPVGTYTVFVNYFYNGSAPATDVPYQVFLNRHYTCDGEARTQTIASQAQGVARYSDLKKPNRVFTFQMPLPPPPSCRS